MMYLLASGRLSDFREWALPGHSEVFGDIAQHFCYYAKSWVEDGTPRDGRGAKMLQFVRTAEGWRISAVAWDDERPGMLLDASPNPTQANPTQPNPTQPNPNPVDAGSDG